MTSQTTIRYEMLTDWPGKSTSSRSASPFFADDASTKEMLLREIRMSRASSATLKMFLPARCIGADGLPLSSAPNVPQKTRYWHPGVLLVLYFGATKMQEYPCDKWPTWRENLRAVAQTRHDLRRIERNGVGTGMEQYAGYELETVKPPTQTSSVSAQSPAGGVLDRVSSASVLLSIAGKPITPDAISMVMKDSDYRRTVYNFAVRTCHPDQGGNSETFLSVQRAKQTLDK